MSLGAGYAAFKVNGCSMQPTLQAGDVLLVKKVRPDELKIGDIVVFYDVDYDRIITHRVIGIDKNSTIMTKPDVTLVQADSGLVGRDRLIGKAITAYRGTQEIHITKSGILSGIFHRMLVMLNKNPLYIKIKSEGYLRGIYYVIMHMRNVVMRRNNVSRK